MKKVLFMAAVAVVFLGSSCKKEKDCSCVTKIGEEVMATTDVTIEDGECSDMNESEDLMDSSITCTEK